MLFRSRRPTSISTVPCSSSIGQILLKSMIELIYKREKSNINPIRISQSTCRTKSCSLPPQDLPMRREPRITVSRYQRRMRIFLRKKVTSLARNMLNIFGKTGARLRNMQPGRCLKRRPQRSKKRNRQGRRPSLHLSVPACMRWKKRSKHMGKSTPQPFGPSGS